MKRITHIFYLHDERRLVDQDELPVTLKKARKFFEAGTLVDYNLALQTLANHNWDMEKVNDHYIAQEALRGKA